MDIRYGFEAVCQVLWRSAGLVELERRRTPDRSGTQEQGTMGLILPFPTQRRFNYVWSWLDSGENEQMHSTIQAEQPTSSRVPQGKEPATAIFHCSPQTGHC